MFYINDYTLEMPPVSAEPLLDYMDPPNIEQCYSWWRRRTLHTGDGTEHAAQILF